MGGSPGNISFPLQALEPPRVTGATFDFFGAGGLTLTFSEAVQAASVTASQLTLTGNVSGVRTNSAAGTKASSTSQTLATTGSSLGSNAFVTLTGPSGVPLFVSTATGLPVAPLTPIVIDNS